MMPVIDTINVYTPPPTLVAAVVPGNQTLRLNADNVPPTVSGVQINNENKNNNGAATSSAPPAPAPATAGSGFSLSPFIYTTPTSLSVGAQTTFIAQLMSQDVSPQAQGVLAGYEQLVAYSNVKYLPSNATLPEPEPANVFGRILQQERQLSTAQQVTSQQQQVATTANVSASISNASLPKEPGAPVRSEPADRPAATTRSSAQPRAAATAAISAYRAVVARNEASSRKNPDQPVEAV